VIIALMRIFLHQTSKCLFKPMLLVAITFFLSGCQTQTLKPQPSNSDIPVDVADALEIVADTPEDIVNAPEDVADVSADVVGEMPQQTQPSSESASNSNIAIYPAAQKIAEKIASNVFIAWSELDSDDSTQAATDLIAEAYQKTEIIAQTDITTEAIPEPIIELDLWQLTVANYGLGKIENARITPHYNWYNKHKKYMHRVTTRASRYYHFMLHTALDQSLPAEIALLPIVESGFDPFAYSSGRASGAWQFIPATGRAFGLKQNWWYDGRRDIVASTKAAHKYLLQLHKMFDGDWLLAIASYNGGQGTVMKAIKRNKKAGKPTDFWSLKLPRETMNYVPKLLAVARVVAEQAGTDTLNSIDDEAYFKLVDVGSQIDLAQAAEMANITTDEMYRLNPAFNQWATDPQGPHHLLIPIAHLDRFKTSLQDLPSSKRVAWERHKIVEGDSLLRLANRYHVSVDLIRTINNIDGYMIRAGKTLMIPIASKDASAYTLSAAQRVINRQLQIGQTQASQRIEYEVKSGDSLWKIAKKYKISIKQIAKWNKLSFKSVLQIGDKLNIWPRSSSKLASAQRKVVKKVTYKVRSGDNLSVIAHRFSVTVKDIKKWNQLLKKYLQPGQQLSLFVNVTKLKQ
jgi:membrane-bound lytic murein transglycosylase D|tara:strand:- start:299 stop:2185 length:1887 start_codon:yes stop_codon:yes gene_type:complete